MSSNNNIPQLRFPGFTGEWEEKRLGDLCSSIIVGFPFKGEDITDDTTGHPILRAYSISEGLIRHGKDYDKYYPKEIGALKKYEVKPNDIVISMDGSVGRNIALVTEKETDYLLIQRVSRLRITDYPIQLIYQQIKSQRFKDYATGEKVGAVIAHISQKQIESYPIHIPSVHDEQMKIADCLSEMDNLIAAQGQKVDALKEKKKGMMQQMFPQKGETTPRLRFPRFTGEWGEKTLGEVADKVNSRNSKLEVVRVLTNSANSGVIDQNEYFDRDIAVKENTGNYHIVDINDFVYNPRISTAAPVGPISINKVGKGIMSPLYTIFRFHSGLIPFYLSLIHI